MPSDYDEYMKDPNRQPVGGFYPHLKARRQHRSDIGDKLYDTFFVPHDAVDLALMLLPYGRVGRSLAAGALALEPGEAQAGKAKALAKSIQQMRDELMLKGVKLDAPADPSRRAFFRMAPETNEFPLSKVEKQAAKEGQAPTITKSTTSVSPDAGKTSRTVEKLIETPVSRRQVLKSGAAQLVQGALPQGALPTTLGGVEEIVGQAAKAVTPGLAATKANIPGLVALAMKQGMSADEAVNFVTSQFRTPPRFGGIMARGEDPAEYLAQHVEDLYGRFQEPFINYNPEFSGAVRPGKAFQEMIGREDERIKPLALKPIMRGLQQADPAKYNELMQAARDRSMASVEELMTHPEVDPEVVNRWMRGELRSLPPSYRDKLDYDY